MAGKEWQRKNHCDGACREGKRRQNPESAILLCSGVRSRLWSTGCALSRGLSTLIDYAPRCPIIHDWLHFFPPFASRRMGRRRTDSTLSASTLDGLASFVRPLLSTESALMNSADLANGPSDHRHDRHHQPADIENRESRACQECSESVMPNLFLQRLNIADPQYSLRRINRATKTLSWRWLLVNRRDATQYRLLRKPHKER